MKIIAKIRTPFPEKFAIPRQSGLTETEGIIVFEPEYRCDEALRGIEEYSHLWLIWEFSEVSQKSWSPTVRPPRLGGNKRVGVFATRSPFRPNPIGLSSVKLTGIEKTNEGTVLKVSGADLMDGTPIYDIKPYLPYTDCHSDAAGGFGGKALSYALDVILPEKLKAKLNNAELKEITSILSQDPRPAYIDEPERVYGFKYKDKEIKFTVANNIATVTEIS
ncbi:MAG: tRNA (N6-threonylcarbamoyladenosine(37)-N6)-methyltransferase TrmO [Clostridia bacterium]|nr:tRNA (N6-threonylcarbamoyladenosine(37)-N6)-methyltransferase TrmO [Clostridia bacterium]